VLKALRTVEGQERDAGEEGQVADPDEQDDLGDRAIGDVATHDVAELVREQGPQLVAGEVLDARRVDDDEGVAESDRAGVHVRRLGDVELGATLPVHRREDVGPEGVEVGTLGGADAHRVRGEEVADGALAEDAGDLVHDLLEAGKLAQRVERGAVGGVLPGEGGDVGQDLAGHVRLLGDSLASPTMRDAESDELQVKGERGKGRAVNRSARHAGEALSPPGARRGPCRAPSTFHLPPAVR
jgi:hypothetical protein